MKINIKVYLFIIVVFCFTILNFKTVKGESYIELSEEEQQCLEKAIYQEEYDIKDMKE